jgi:Domain of unknown function (DUF4249)
MKQYICFSLLSLVTLLLLTHCVEPVNFQSVNEKKTFVVNGTFNNLAERQVVYISQTTRVGTAPNPWRGAIVTLYRSDDGKKYDYQDNSDGSYSLETTTPIGEVGKTYYLEVKLPTLNRVFRSDPQKMPAPVAADSLYIKVEDAIEEIATGESRKYIAVNAYISTPLQANGQPAYLRWSTESAFQVSSPEPSVCGNFPPPPKTCYFIKANNTQNVAIATGITGIARLPAVKVGSEAVNESYRFIETRYYSVIQQSITPVAYQYWSKIAAVSSQNGSIFDAIPSGVYGNVHPTDQPSEGILGYFEVSGATILRKKYNGNDINPYYRLTPRAQLCRDPQSTISRFRACCNCDNLPDGGLTLIKPSYW